MVYETLITVYSMNKLANDLSFLEVSAIQDKDIDIQFCSF